MNTTPKILVLATGGTITGHSAAIEPNQRQNPKADNVHAKLTFKTVADLDSTNIGPDLWTALADLIKIDTIHDGFVITHGTNTMAYTSAALSFALAGSSRPVIITGARIPAGQAGSDANRNFTDAIRVAAGGQWHELNGVCAVFDGKIIAGTRVVINGSGAVVSHQAPPLGEIGQTIMLDTDAVDRHNEFYNNGTTILNSEFDDRVLVLRLTPGMTSQDLILTADYAFTTRGGIKGLVLQTYGDGDIPTVLRDAVFELANSGLPIVVTSQTYGRVDMVKNEPGLYVKNRMATAPGKGMSLEAATVKLMWILKRGYESFFFDFPKNVVGEVDNCYGGN